MLNFDANYTFDTQGKIATVQHPTTHPSGNPVAGPTYTYGFDSMDRPSTLTDQGNSTIVSSVSYGPSNELLTIAYGNYLTGVSYENRTYNSLLQLTGLTTSSGLIGAMNLTYTYPAAANIGKISSMTDAIVGETVQYTYDSLNRLIKAQTSSATTPWGQGFVYDGFGNLTAKQVTLGSAPTMSNPVNGATNQGGGGFDSNGNMTSVGSSTYTYDVKNRLKQASPSGGGTVYYGYDTQNRRVWQWSGGTDQYGTPALCTVYFYGVTGQRLASYTVAMALTSQLVLESQVVLQDTYFGSKRVAAMDRLGSTRGAGNNSGGYYPYGEDKGTPAVNDRWKFGTYWRDSATGLDYAMNRYYSSTLGRFMTQDPGGIKTVDPTDPASWNRYAYGGDDPVNYLDPGGLFRCNPDFCKPISTVPAPPSQYNGSNGSTGPTFNSVVHNPLGLDDWTLLDEWDNLSQDCQSALQSAMPGGPGNINGQNRARVMALNRALSAEGVLQQAVAGMLPIGGAGISWELLAAIGIEESHFQNIPEQGGGNGKGVFQIDTGVNPSVSASQAFNIQWAAKWAASLLYGNLNTLATQHPNLDPTQLLQATAASYNFGAKNISGDPSTIDVGTKNGHYGSTAVALINCFQ